MPSFGEKNPNIVLSDFLTAAKCAVKNASQALMTMSGDNVGIDVLTAGVAPTARLAEVAGDPEEIVAGIYIKVDGDIPGHALLVFPWQYALQLVDLIMGSPAGTTAELDEMGRSIVQEVCNVVTSNYLSALADLYGCRLLPNPPVMAIDMAAAIFDSVLLNTGHYEGDTLSIVTRFGGVRYALRGFFLYIPEIAASVQ